MANKFVVAVACLGLAATAGAELNFDQGIDVKDIVAQSETSDLKGPYPQYGHNRVRYSKDCRNFSFGPSAYAVNSQRFFLDSTEYIEICRFVPKPKPPPTPPPPVNPPKPPNPPVKPPRPPRPPRPDNNGGGPREYSAAKDGPHHGEYAYAGTQNGRDGTWYCNERVGQSFHATAQVNIAPRKLLPWESESFEVCMEGPRVDFNPRSSPYSYSVDREGMYDLAFNLTPRYRVPTPPDGDGLYATGFSFKDGKFALSVGDRWAGEYAGEKVMVKVELFKDGFLFFNSNKGEKEFTFDAAAGYEVVFAENELVKNKDFVDDSADKGGAAKYYVKWGFRRVGQVSTDDYMNKGKTDKIGM